MADYRQFCRNPKCNYNGFNTHVAGCYVVEESVRWDKERLAQREKDRAAWEKFFDAMDDEQYASYMELCQGELDRVERFRIRLQKAREYGRNNGRLMKYHDSKRDNG
jgi:hypothetical protein